MYGHVRKMQLDNGVEAWDFGSYQYVNDAVNKIQYYIRKHNIWKLPAKSTTPTTTTYKPELGATHELQPPEESYYTTLICILRRTVEI